MPRSYTLSDEARAGREARKPATRRALLDAGIPVLAVPPADGRPVEEAAEPLLEAIAQDPPQAVFFWNVITSRKVLLTDALPGIRIFAAMSVCSVDRRAACRQVPARTTPRAFRSPYASL